MSVLNVGAQPVIDFPDSLHRFSYYCEALITSRRVSGISLRSVSCGKFSQIGVKFTHETAGAGALPRQYLAVALSL